jgi:hypothetical protein
MANLQLQSLTFRRADAEDDLFAPLLRGRGPGVVTAPEWQTGVSHTFTDSPVACVLNACEFTQPPELAARFRCSDPVPLHIRAIANAGSPLLVPEQVLRAAGPDGTTLVRLHLRRDLGVRVDDVTLTWQERQLPSTQWKTFATTQLRVYRLLASPGPPWTTKPGQETAWVWTEVLEIACREAAGTADTRAAATAIARWCVSLERSSHNPAGLYLGCGARFTQQSPSVFDCGALLDYLAGGGRHRSCIECTDAAALLSTFANALGCRLLQARLGGELTRPVVFLGSTAPEQRRFSFHEVAWAGEAGAADLLWDSTVQLSADGGQLLPAFAIPFDDGSAHSYRPQFYADPSKGGPRGVVSPDNRTVGPLRGTVRSVWELLPRLLTLHPELESLDLPAVPQPPPILTTLSVGRALLRDVEWAPPEARLTELQVQVDGQLVFVEVETFESPEQARAQWMADLLTAALPLTPVKLNDGVAVLVPAMVAIQKRNVRLVARIAQQDEAHARAVFEHLLQRLDELTPA